MLTFDSDKLGGMDDNQLRVTPSPSSLIFFIRATSIIELLYNPDAFIVIGFVPVPLLVQRL